MNKSSLLTKGMGWVEDHLGRKIYKLIRRMCTELPNGE
jgi:hypothetical protein